MSLFSSQQPPESLCILRLSAIGDVCNVLAVVQQIQRYWPQTEITWIIGKVEYQLLQHVNGINFVIYDKKSGWKGIWNLWKSLKRKKFDALLNMQTAIRASILSLGIKAKYKIGFGKKRSREWQSLFVNQQISDPEQLHVLDGFIEFAKFLGVPVNNLSWDLATQEADKEKMKVYLNPKCKNLLISPCSSKAEKDWLPERYAEIANLAHQQQINVIFCGSPSSREMKTVQQIIDSCNFIPKNACGKTTLQELTALISLVDLVIAPDSGPLHIANAQKTTVIGLYAYHNPLRTGAYCQLQNIISVYEQNVIKEFNKPSIELPWATKLKGKNLMAQIQTQDVIYKMKQIGFL
ncbi:glycosyltransferase family 9 protein [Seminibacterium arietis]|uniref:Glycosyltransferase family 9 protein n=1 Tax=Seminibacterium arietis TaxID=1173502 RepID=A0ABW3IAS5_9PAST